MCLYVCAWRERQLRERRRAPAVAAHDLLLDNLLLHNLVLHIPQPDAALYLLLWCENVCRTQRRAGLHADAGRVCLGLSVHVHVLYGSRMYCNYGLV